MPTTVTSPADTSTKQRVLPATSENRIVNLLDAWQEIQPLWDDFVENHPKGCVFHTSQMVRVFLGTRANRPMPLASLTPDGRIAALLVSVRVQTLPPPMGRLSSRAIFYAEPLCNDHPDSMKALSQLLARHDYLMQRSALFAEVRPLFAPGSERIVMERSGYEYLEYLNYLYDVGQPIKAQWSEVHKSAQRAIRQCEKRGLTVAEVRDDAAIDMLYPLLQLSYGHSGVPLADKSLFEAAVAELVPHGYAKFFAVFEDNLPVAMDVMLTYKDRIYFWYGGVSRAAAGSPCSMLRWHEFQWAHENGFAVCDSGGAGWPGVPYGVREFKRKFGGELVQYGRYRKVYSPWKLAVAERAYNLKRKIFAGR